MHRRTFLKAAAAVGLSVAAPVATTKKAHAQGLFEGPYWFFIHARGGWDPTSLCDPKGNQEGTNRYDTSAIGEAGNLRYAPMGNNEAFFQAHYQRLCIVNGIDMSTNGHQQGTRYTWSGQLNEGHPTLAALIAAKQGPSLPMSFITNGGYDMTGGVIAATRADRVDTIPRIAYSNRIRPDSNDTFHSNYAMERIKQAADARLEAKQQKMALPKMRNAMSALHTARLGEAELRDVLQYLPEDLNNNNGLINQARVALAAFRAGLGVSVNLETGGFDTHGDHDNRHMPRLDRVTEGVDFIINEAERMGIGDKIIIVVGSDFGRTPGYNGGNGKDHWSINSMMLMGPGIPGNTVIGQTDMRHGPINVNPETLQADPNGIRIRPEHVHAELRRLGGIERDQFTSQFPVNPNDQLRLFGS